MERAEIKNIIEKMEALEILEFIGAKENMTISKSELGVLRIGKIIVNEATATNWIKSVEPHTVVLA